MLSVAWLDLGRKRRAPLAVRQAVADASDIREGWLFLGGQMAASSLDGLQQIGITHVLNCCERVPCKFRFLACQSQGLEIV